jgi:ribosome-associated translation inhibitor RaiA
MQIQVNSDHTVETPKGFSEYVSKTIEEILHNCQSQITRIKVHFSDVNGAKSGTKDKSCTIEARLAGRKPIAVSDRADTFNDVISGAAEKLKHALETILEKEHDHHPNHGADDKNLFLKKKIINAEALDAVNAKVGLLDDQAHVLNNSN